MTPLNQTISRLICDYCANNQSGCLADVPSYLASVFCSYFAEPVLEPKPKRGRSMKQIMKTALVETL